MPPRDHTAGPTGTGVSLDEDAVARALEAVVSGDDAALCATDAADRIVERLAAAAAEPDTVARLLAGPRPSAAGGAHPGRLLLYAIARQYRFDGTAPDVGADYLEALDASLARGARAWASAAATAWLIWIHHELQASEAWPVARLLLERHADADAPATMLSALATLAERAGDVDASTDLWSRARAHTDVVRSARTRWLVDYDWARGRLLLSDGAVGRAAHVLERVHVGLAANEDALARLVGINAGLELAMCQVLLGRCRDATALAIAGVARLGPDDGEYRCWWRGVEALALALCGDVPGAHAAAHDQDGAATDTTSLDLSCVLPALAVAGAVRGDDAEIDAAVARARAHEVERPVDPELRALWRVFCGWALVRRGRLPDARDLTRELLAALDASPVELPAYARHAAALAAAARGDDRALVRALADLTTAGTVLAPDARDPWGIVPRAGGSAVVHARPQPSLRIEVLDGIRALLDGEEVTTREWTRRRKARIALAMLTATGGRLDRDALADALWSGETLDPTTRQGRLSTVLAGLRRAILATPSGGAAAPGRSLVLGPVEVELHLGESDETDLHELRRLARAVAAADPREPRELLRIASDLVPLAAGDPLRGLDVTVELDELAQSLRHELAAVCMAVLGAWRVADDLADGLAAQLGAVPGPVLQLAAHAVRLQPHDEVAAAHHMDLLAATGRHAEATQVFHRLRERLAHDLGLGPSVDLVRRHAALI